jgi:hypothetical protein
LSQEVGQSGEGQPLIELRRRDGQHTTAGALGDLAGRPEQAALADARLTGNDDLSACRTRIGNDLKSRLAPEKSESFGSHRGQRGSSAQPPQGPLEGFPRRLGSRSIPSLMASVPANSRSKQ